MKVSLIELRNWALFELTHVLLIEKESPVWVHIMSSTAIELGPQGNTLSKEDLSRALFCSQAVYESVPGAEILIGNTQREYPALSFEKVHMSLDHDVLEGLKFMVAYANDAIFIAFRGTTTPQPLAKTLRMDNHHMKFHAGFFERANVFMGPGHKNIMHELIRSGKRIIFCGHSLGGAVAHMVLLRILLEDNWIPDEVSHSLNRYRFKLAIYR